ncbi:MAG: sigma-70 family RNA polymerase sigma factor [Cyanobacteria bacterium SIG27]|nr:sigma-70 family RNA polymerase sigma factor [Cyanobacteria bacterium SIG27]
MDSEKNSLITRAIKNDKEALGRLLRSIQGDIYSMLFYLKKDENDLSDLAQEILLKVSKKIYQLKNPKYFKTWLNQIIINSYYDYLRKQKKKNNYYDKNIEDRMFEIPDYRQNLSQNIIDNELDLIIKNSINNLPIKYKIPIALREIQGLSYDEISNLTKTSIGTVKSRISRARAKIKDDIDKYSRDV